MDMSWVPERNLIGMATRRLSVMSRAELAGERVGDEVADVDVDELLDLLWRLFLNINELSNLERAVKRTAGHGKVKELDTSWRIKVW
jgi:hypothetical protein